MTAGELLRRVPPTIDRADAEWILAHVLGCARAELRLRDEPLTDGEREAVQALVARRERGEPLQYVLGEWGFRRLTLTVDPRALIPRPETEVVVERCLALLAGTTEPRVLDVGTGSGAIALAIADEHPGARVTAIDLSEGALALARENAERTGLAVELLRVDLLHGLPGEGWDLVVSNPPYVRPDELPTLEPQVREWEPRTALVGEGHTEAVVREAARVLGAGGVLVLETHGEHAAEVADLLRAHGLSEVRVTPDLAGRARVVEGRRP